MRIKCVSFVLAVAFLFGICSAPLIAKDIPGYTKVRSLTAEEQKAHPNAKYVGTGKDGKEHLLAEFNGKPFELGTLDGSHNGKGVDTSKNGEDKYDPTRKIEEKELTDAEKKKLKDEILDKMEKAGFSEEDRNKMKDWLDKADGKTMQVIDSILDNKNVDFKNADIRQKFMDTAKEMTSMPWADYSQKQLDKLVKAIEKGYNQKPTKRGKANLAAAKNAAANAKFQKAFSDSLADQFGKSTNPLNPLETAQNAVKSAKEALKNGPKTPGNYTNGPSSPPSTGTGPGGPGSGPGSPGAGAGQGQGQGQQGGGSPLSDMAKAMQDQAQANAQKEAQETLQKALENQNELLKELLSKKDDDDDDDADDEETEELKKKIEELEEELKKLEEEDSGVKKIGEDTYLMEDGTIYRKTDAGTLIIKEEGNKTIRILIKDDGTTEITKTEN